MSPKIFSWLLRAKGRKIIISPKPGPNGGSYTVELRQGVSTAVKKEVSRYTVERFVGNNMRNTLESMVPEIDALIEEKEDDD